VITKEGKGYFRNMKNPLLIIALIFLSTAANAQLWKLRRVELSGGIGTTQFFGDIGGYPNNKNILGLRDFTFRQTRFNLNANVRYRVTRDISVRFSIAGGLFHSTDERGSNIRRGFRENTLFFEPTLSGEYYFIKNKEENSFIFLSGNNTFLKSVIKSLDFYAFAGAGGLMYRVEPNSVLTPLTSATKGFTGVVPLGIGASIIYSANLNFGIEFGGRFTFSDNIDGFTSSKSNANDVYHLLNFTITYKIKKPQK
jgi:hypothetical protein